MTTTTAPAPVLGDDIESIIDDLYGIDPHLDRALDALTDLATTRRDADRTQTVIACLAGSRGADLVSFIGSLVQHLTSDANPALADLPAHRQKNACRWGEQAAAALLDPDLHAPAAEACGAIDIN